MSSIVGTYSKITFQLPQGTLHTRSQSNGRLARARCAGHVGLPTRTQRRLHQHDLTRHCSRKPGVITPTQPKDRPGGQRQGVPGEFSVRFSESGECAQGLEGGCEGVLSGPPGPLSYQP